VIAEVAGGTAERRQHYYRWRSAVEFFPIADFQDQVVSEIGRVGCR